MRCNVKNRTWYVRAKGSLDAGLESILSLSLINSGMNGCFSDRLPGVNKKSVILRWFLMGKFWRAYAKGKYTKQNVQKNRLLGPAMSLLSIGSHAFQLVYVESQTNSLGQWKIIFFETLLKDGTSSLETTLIKHLSHYGN